MELYENFAFIHEPFLETSVKLRDASTYKNVYNFTSRASFTVACIIANFEAKSTGFQMILITQNPFPTR